jgi:hypothetical protein
LPAWLIPILAALAAKAAPVVLAGAGAVISYLIHRYVKNAKLADALLWIANHVGPVVAAVEQTFVDGLAAGGMTDAQKTQALNQALSAILAQIPAQYLDVLHEAYPGDSLNAYLVTLIEGAVKTLEVSKPGALSLAAPSTAGALSRVPDPAPATGPFDAPGMSNPKANPPR